MTVEQWNRTVDGLCSSASVEDQRARQGFSPDPDGAPQEEKRKLEAFVTTRQRIVSALAQQVSALPLPAGDSPAAVFVATLQQEADAIDEFLRRYRPSPADAFGAGLAPYMGRVDELSGQLHDQAAQHGMTSCAELF